MTAPAYFRRDATDVQAMRLDDITHMGWAYEWLRSHGVLSEAITWAPGRISLTIYGPGTRMVARLGDWLTLDVGSGVFAVEDDDGGKPSGHTKVEVGE